mgnify:CR=1 FL=1
MCIFQRKCVLGLSVKQLRHTLNIYCSYLQLINVRYWIFRHFFKKNLAISLFFVRFNWKLTYWQKNMLKLTSVKFHKATQPWYKFMTYLKLCHFFCTTWYINAFYLLAGCNFSSISFVCNRCLKNKCLRVYATNTEPIFEPEHLHSGHLTIPLG